MVPSVSFPYDSYVSSSRISPRIKKEFFYGSALFFVFCTAFCLTLSQRKVQIACAGFFLFLTRYFFSKAQKVCDYTNEIELKHLREEAEKAVLEASLKKHGSHFFVVVSEVMCGELFWKEGFSNSDSVENLFLSYEKQKNLFQRYNLEERFVKVIKIKEEKREEVRRALGLFMQRLESDEIGKEFFRKEIPRKACELGIITEQERQPLEGEDNLLESFCEVVDTTFCRRTEESKERQKAFEALRRSLS